MRVSVVSVVLVCALAASGCATRRVATESPLASAEERWEQLRDRAAEASGWRALSRVQWVAGDRTQGFDATFVADDRGHLAMEGLTPIGTTAASLWTDGLNLTFLNHRGRTWWTGPLDTIPETAPLVPALRSLGVSAAAGLLFGYPQAEGTVEVCESVIPDTICRRVDAVEYHINRAGLVRASTVGAQADFEPPSVPATSVRIRTSAGVLTVTNRAVEPADEAVEAPQPDPSWRCCVLPSFE